MSLKSINPTKTLAWKKLETHFEFIKDQQMKDWFSINPKRAEEMSIEWEDFFIDFSKNRLNTETMSLFKDLVNEIKLSDAILNIIMELKLMKQKKDQSYALPLEKKNQPMISEQ